MPEHNLLTGTSLHEAKRIKEPVRTASTVNLTLATPGASMDSVTLANGDRVLLKDQSTAAQNGIYIFNGAASLLTRADDADSATDFFAGFKVYVAEGTTNAGRTYTYTTAGAITLGSTSLTFTNDQLTDSAASANTVKAGPTSGGAATPSYRALVSADVPVMVASGGSHASGAAPDPGSSAGTTRYLREDASWQVPPGSSGGSSTGGTGGSIVPIQTQTSNGSSGTITFSNLPTSFRNLRLTITGRTTTASASVRVNLQYNGDSTGGNYANIQLFGNGSTTGSGTASLGTGAYIGDIAGTTATANTPTVVSALIYEYRGTTFNKACESYGGTAGGTNLAAITTGTWVNTAAISSIAVVLASGNWVTGSVLTLWGEADTAPVLMTSNSNMIQETILTAAQASISITSIPQGYRDLRITLQARGDTSATSTTVLAQFNGDTGSNYDTSWMFGSATTGASVTGPTTSALVAEITAATGPSNSADVATLTIPNYSLATFQKSGTSVATLVRSDTVSGNDFASIYRLRWRSTAAITSILLFPNAGNFAAGTVVRVYGEPAASAGTSVGTGTRLRLSGNQSITTATATAITWDTEDNDADNQHFTSAANLTGTVTKSASSATLSGSSTAFLTELSVGQVISVPGTAAEKRVVIAIASNTSLTVNSSFVNSASGQTATRVNSAVVFRQPGFYTLEANIYSAALSTGAVTLAYYLNSLTTATSGTAIGQRDPVAVNASAGYDLVAVRQFNQWDFVEVVWTQNSGGSVNVTADERTHWSISARPTVLIAVPYINIQDQKTSGTAGGTFTSGADRTRDLNSISSDTAGIATLSSNQFTLPPGTYRTAIRAPAALTARHQAWLYDVTDSAVLLRGASSYANATGNVQSDSVISGKFTITASTTFEVRHRAESTSATNGFGVPGSFGTEVYTVVELWKEG